MDKRFLIKKETTTAWKIIIEIVESEGIEEFEEVSFFIKQAKVLGISVVVEFVHCQEVKEMGIEFSQGFLFDKPKQLI